MKSRFQSVYHFIVDWVHKLKNSHRKSLSVRYPYSIPIVDATASDSQTFGIGSTRVVHPLQNGQGVVSLFSRLSLGNDGLGGSRLSLGNVGLGGSRLSLGNVGSRLSLGNVGSRFRVVFEIPMKVVATLLLFSVYE